MNKKELAKFKTQLLGLRQEVDNQGAVVVKSEKSLPHEILDEDVQPLSEMSQIIASNRNRNRSVSLGKIEAALFRLEHRPDMFGLCQECEDPIPAKRLDLMPFVELCARCQQEKDEAGKPSSGRRHLTDYT